MIHDIFTSIEGVGLYPIITLILFLVVFVAVGLWALFANREYLDHMKQLPLEDSDLSVGVGERKDG